MILCGFSERLRERTLSQGVPFKATPHKARLTAWRRICLHLFRHLAQKFLAGRQPSGVISIQSDEKSDGSNLFDRKHTAPPALCGIAFIIAEKQCVFKSAASEQNTFPLPCGTVVQRTDTGMSACSAAKSLPVFFRQIARKNGLHIFCADLRTALEKKTDLWYTNIYMNLNATANLTWRITI